MKKKLSEVCKFQYGYPFDSSLFSDKTGTPVIRIRDIIRGFSETKTTETCSADYIVNNGDILIGMDGEFNIAKWEGGKAFLNQRVCKLIPFDVNKDYIFYHLPKILKSIEEKTSFATVKHLSAKQLNSIYIDIPEQTIQYKIANVFIKIDSLINKRKQQLSKLDQLVKSRFVEMFGDPILNTKKFPVYRMDEVVKFIGGSQPDKKHFEYSPTPDNIRLIQIRDYKSDKFITYIPKSMAKRHCTADDIMIGRYGPPIFQILQGIEGSYNVALMKAVPLRGNKEFIRYFLKQEALLHYLESLSSRTAGQDGIQMDKLKEYPFPFPPLIDQENFATFIKQVDKTKLSVKQSLEKLETLKKSLMQEYFG